MDILYQKLIHSIDPTVVSVQEIWSPRSILWIEKNAKLGLALQILKENRILSLPVLDAVSNQCIGVVDVMDIAFFVAAKFPSLDTITREQFSNLEWNGVVFMKTVSVFEVIAFSKAYSFSNLPNFPTFTTTQLIYLIQTFSTGIHRVPILNLGKVVNFISQTDLMRFIAENIFALKGKAHRTVQDLGLYRDIVHFVRADLVTIQAINFLIMNKVSAVPILDSSGALAGNFSASDLRGLSEIDFPHLLDSVYEFLNHFNPKSLFPLTCRPTDTLEQVIFKMVGAHVHRLWCVNEFNRVLGVISMTDVFKTFFVEIAPMEF